MKLIVGNQKTYLNKDEVLEFINKTTSCNEVVVCPSYVYIDMYNNNSNYTVGAQNVSEKGNGATTGEISAEQLKSLNVKYCIVGHSERRDEQKETSEMLFNKIVKLLENDIKPIFCIGEHLEERESGKTEELLHMQVEKDLAGWHRTLNILAPIVINGVLVLLALNAILQIDYRIPNFVEDFLCLCLLMSIVFVIIVWLINTIIVLRTIARSKEKK